MGSLLQSPWRCSGLCICTAFPMSFWLLLPTGVRSSIILFFFSKAQRAGLREQDCQGLWCLHQVLTQQLPLLPHHITSLTTVSCSYKLIHRGVLLLYSLLRTVDSAPSVDFCHLKEEYTSDWRDFGLLCWQEWFFLTVADCFCGGTGRRGQVQCYFAQASGSFTCRAFACGTSSICNPRQV